MTNDPLVIEAIRIIKAEEAELLEVMCVSNIQSMYEVGKAQGRLQGLRRAIQAIDEASRTLYEEE